MLDFLSAVAYIQSRVLPSHTFMHPEALVNHHFYGIDIVVNPVR